MNNSEHTQNQMNPDNENENIKTLEVKENENTGVIYCLTNKITNKSYIGQAVSYKICHGKPTYHSMTGRFKEHCNNALSGSESCPKLYASMRKYGIGNFNESLLAVASTDSLNDLEIKYIKEYDTVKNGYNISPGGNMYVQSPENRSNRRDKIQASMLKRWQDPEYAEKTKAANLIAVTKRANEGTTRKKNKELDLPANIYKIENGYGIQVMRDGKYKNTDVTSTTLSDEELLQNAIKKRDEILHNMDNDIDDSHQKKVDHNGNELPKGIVLMKFKGIPGYRVIIRKKIKGTKKDIRRERNFIDSKLTMDQKLELAKKALVEMNANKEELINKPVDDRLDHNGNVLSTHIRLAKEKNKIVGYQVSCNGKTKQFYKQNMSMDKKLEMAKNALVIMSGDDDKIDEINCRLDHNNNPLPNYIFLVNKKGVASGYLVKYMDKCKKICKKTLTMDEKLNQAKEYLAQEVPQIQ